MYSVSPVCVSTRVLHNIRPRVITEVFGDDSFIPLGSSFEWIESVKYNTLPGIQWPLRSCRLVVVSLLNVHSPLYRTMEWLYLGAEEFW